MGDENHEENDQDETGNDHTQSEPEPEHHESSPAADKPARSEDRPAHGKGFWDKAALVSQPIIALVSVVALMLTVYFGAKQYNVAEKMFDAAKDQIRQAESQLRLSLLSQLEDRYYRALEMLGSEHVDLRVDAVGELVEISAASVPADRRGYLDYPYRVSAIKALTTFVETRSSFACAPDSPPLGLDVQSAVNAIGSKSSELVNKEGEEPYGDTRSSRYRQMQLDKEREDQEYKQKEYIAAHNQVFSKTNVPVCWSKARLDASFDQLSFAGVMMPGVTLEGASFQLAVFDNDHLEGLEAHGGSFASAWFDGAWLMRAKFLAPQQGYGPNLSGASFIGAKLCDAVIEGDVSGADFRDAKLYRADFSKAIHLTRNQVIGAQFDPNTITWPTEGGFQPPAPSKPSDGHEDC